MGKRSLARGGRSRDHDKFFPGPLRDHLRDLPDLFLLQRLLDQDQVIGVASGDLIVQGPHIGKAQLISPPGGLGHHLKQLPAGLKLWHMLRVIPSGKHQHKAVAVLYQVKVLHIPCVLDHIPVKIVLKPGQVVQIHPGSHAIPEQTGLVLHPVPGKQLHRLIRVDAALHNRQFLGHIVLHLLFYPQKKLIRNGHIPLYLHEKPFSQGKFHTDPLHPVSAHNVVKCLQHNQLGAALIRLHPRLMPRRNKLHPAVRVNRLVQLHQFPVYRNK